MPRRLPKGCVEDKDRHGNYRIYYREPYMPKVLPGPRTEGVLACFAAKAQAPMMVR